MSLRYLLLNQLAFLQQMGYDVVGISAPGNNISAIEATGVRHISIPMSRKTINPVADLLTIWRLYKVFRRENFTIVHTHFHKSGIYGRWAAKLARVPIIIHTSHGLIFHERSSSLWLFIFGTLEKIAAKCSDLIFSVNKEDIKTIIDERICSPNKVQSLGQGGIGINLALFDPARFSLEDISLKRGEIGIPSHVKVVGFVGRLVREKGILELFEAAQIVRKRIRDVRFLIVGPIDNDKFDAVTPDVAANYGVSDICICTGIRQDMPELYALMNVLVLPSHREGFPRSPMEASAMGVPCIVTDIRGCREAVENGRNGLLVPVGDVQALADAIIELLTDKEKAQRMGAEGRRLALERFDERQVFEKVKSEYARLLREKGFPVPGESQDD
jgi:glycosyltransferase involved in cell wall biosynthesis